MDVRQGLGVYRFLPGVRAPAPGQLNAHDTGELIRRAGLEAGLVPVSRLAQHGAIGMLGRIDWAWFDESATPRVAFQLEGCGVTATKYRGRLDQARENLDRSSAAMKVVVLFEVDQSSAVDLEVASAEKQAIIKYLGRPDLHVLLDRDLWEGIEQLARTRMPR